MVQFSCRVRLHDTLFNQFNSESVLRKLIFLGLVRRVHWIILFSVGKYENIVLQIKAAISYLRKITCLN